MDTVTNLKSPVNKWKCGAAPITVNFFYNWSPFLNESAFHSSGSIQRKSKRFLVNSLWWPWRDGHVVLPPVKSVSLLSTWRVLTWKEKHTSISMKVYLFYLAITSFYGLWDFVLFFYICRMLNAECSTALVVFHWGRMHPEIEFILLIII